MREETLSSFPPSAPFSCAQKHLLFDALRRFPSLSRYPFDMSLFRRRSFAEKELPAAPEPQPATPQQYGGAVPRALLDSAATGRR